MSKKDSKKGLAPLDRPVRDDIRPNQWIGNPKQERCMVFYLEPSSETFGNMFASAKKAGYRDSYAKVVSSPAVANKWVQEYRNRAMLDANHITAGIQRIATDRHAKDADKLRAYELLAKLQGLMVDRSISAHVNIEQALNELR